MQVWIRWREGTVSNLVDGWIRGGSTAEIVRCIHIAMLCVQEKVADGPTMNSVVIMLGSHSLSLPAHSTPAFFMHSSIRSNMPRVSDHNSSTFVQVFTNGASITDLFAR